MGKKKANKKRRQHKGGSAAGKKRDEEKNDDDAFLEEAMQAVEAEKQQIMNISCGIDSFLSIEVIIFLSNDVLGSVSSFLACKDLFHLSLTCKQMTDAIEKVAMQKIDAANVRYGGDSDNLSTLGKMHRLLYSPIEFTDLLGKHLGYFSGDRSCVYSFNPIRLHTPQYIDEMNIQHGRGWDNWGGINCAASCSDYVMTSGRHFAKFTVTSLENSPSGSSQGQEDSFRYFYCRFGLMRPIQLKKLERSPLPGYCPLYDQLVSGMFLDGGFAEHYRTDAWGDGNVHCCLYYDFQGTCEWSNWNSKEDGIFTGQRWDGMIGGTLTHDIREYGLLLDLDVGTLSMYQGNRCLGVMMSGLTGEYCWVTSILAQAYGKPSQQNVRIERAPVPSDV